MENELKILPLRQYEITRVNYNAFDGGDAIKDVFTADFHTVTEDRRTVFYRTGNIIREYHCALESIVITPVDE